MTAAPSLFLIAGPTASGKSALALWLAERLGGEIVNADALQLYRDLSVLSARPTAEEAARVPHHLFGIADAADGWSVGRWARAAEAVLAGIAARGRPAVVVGGTGLYFRALTVGLAEIPAVPLADAQALAALGEAALRAELERVDPEAAARIFPGDLQRLTRALAVFRATARPLSAWQAETAPMLAPGSWRGVVLEPPRAALYARCDARLKTMIQLGALDEAAAIVARGLSPALPAMKAVGLRELAAHLAGRASLADAVAEAQKATRNYAKRQLTWFRNQTPGWPRLDETTAEGQQRQFLALIGDLTATKGHVI
jgi:tRNA dimethylallyltransferase